jgi:group II intron reverse transcriptase/maturase
MSTELLRVKERARKDPSTRFRSLAHLIDEAALERAFHRQRKDAAVGVDGVTKEQYEQNLEANLRDLHGRLVAKRYRHQPIRRTYIPKARGKKRTIGVSCFEDKLVQESLRAVLEAVYEPLFLDCSYGFRPGRSPHDALRALDRAAMAGEMSSLLEADVTSYFDSLDRRLLVEMLRRRVGDPSLLRLVGKCLHVGVLDGEQYSEPEVGTVQGSVLSPLLGNIYLHYVLDEWFASEVAGRLRSKAHLIRYADDFIIGFSRRDDAQQVMGELGERMTQYGLKLHPDKTRIVSFTRPRRERQEGKGRATFNFLGFTVYWRRSRRGNWVLGLKTRADRLRRATRSAYDFCRCNRHWSIEDQHAGICRKLNGHYSYFGVNGNLGALRRLHEAVRRAWHKWLDRRGSPKPLTWERFVAILEDYPLPEPRVSVSIWSPSP